MKSGMHTVRVFNVMDARCAGSEPSKCRKRLDQVAGFGTFNEISCGYLDFKAGAVCLRSPKRDFLITSQACT